MSTTALYERLRTAGAAARDVLVRAAAQELEASTSRSAAPRRVSSSTARGDTLVLRRARRGRGAAAAEPAPPLKDRDRFRLIGKPLARLDTPAKCNGSAIYGIDVVVPGMLNAAIKTAPSFTGQVVAIRNEADILKMPGVRAVVKIPASDRQRGREPAAALGTPRDNAVCVVADYFWQAKRAIDALDVDVRRRRSTAISRPRRSMPCWMPALNAEHGVAGARRRADRAKS